MRRHCVWLVTLPLVLAGIEGGHALANLVVGAPDGELFASPGNGRDALPLAAAVLLAAVVAALGARAGGFWRSSYRRSVVAAPFAVLPPLGFVLLELGESLSHSEPFGWRSVTGATFVAGFVLQVPVGILGFFVARGLLRLSDEVGFLLLRYSSQWRGLCRTQVSSDRRAQVPCGLLPAGSVRGRAPPVAAALS